MIASKKPLYSIVIPTYNEERYIGELLSKLRTQTLQPKEIIVADAFSTDKTREIAKSYKAKVIDGGLPGPGRNRGIEKSKTDIVLFLDADVIITEDDFLERAVTEFIERDLSISTADLWPIHGTKHDYLAYRVYNTYVHLLKNIRPHVPGFFILVKKSLHEEIGGFDETVIFLEDQEYVSRAARRGTFDFLTSVVVMASTRRQDRDGRLNMEVKYILAELYMIFFGPIRTNIFNYTFGHDE